MQVAPPRPDRPAPPRPTLAAAARLLLAVTLAWIGVVGAWRLSSLERTIHDSHLLPPGAVTASALVWSLGALAAAGALTNRAAVFVGAIAATLLAGGALAVSIAAWLHGSAVVCTCIDATLRHSTRDHVEAVAGDMLLLVLAVSTTLTARHSFSG